MSNRVDVREELRKLKLIAEHTEEWASKVTSFLVVTQDLCKSAASVLYHLDDDAWEIETVLVNGAETVADAVTHVVELAREKSTEVVNHFQGMSKGANCNHKELQAKVEQATLAVGLAIFETLQLQAEEFGKLAEKSIGAAKRSASALAPKLSSIARLSSGTPHCLTALPSDRGKAFWEDGKSEVTGTDDVELDWDAFENDLKAMTDVVETGLTSAEEAIRTRESAQFASAEIKALRLKIDELEVEKSSALYRVMQAEKRSEEALHRAETAETAGCEALLRAEQAEEAVTRLQREHGSRELEQPCHTDDDFAEVQRALKAEQVARLQAEERLRAAETDARSLREDASAARLALEMTQKVAAGLVDGGSTARADSVASSGRGGGAVGFWDSRGTDRRISAEFQGAEDDSDVGSQTTDVILSKSASQKNLESLGGRQDRRGSDDRRAFGSMCEEDLDARVTSPRVERSERAAEEINPFEMPIGVESRDSRVARSWTSECTHGQRKDSVARSHPPVSRQGSSDVGVRTRDNDGSNPFLCGQGEWTKDEDYVNPFENGTRGKTEDAANGRRRTSTVAPTGDDYMNPFEAPAEGRRGETNPFEGAAASGVDDGYENPFESKGPTPPAPRPESNPFVPPGVGDPYPPRQSKGGTVPQQVTEEICRDGKGAPRDNRTLRASSHGPPAPRPKRNGPNKSKQPASEGWNPFMGAREALPPRGATWNPFESPNDSDREKKPPVSRSSWNPFH